MTDDLISRMDAVQATRVGPSDEWSRDTKGGYELAATDCMMNVLKIKTAADLSSPLGAVAMREAAVAEIDCGGCYGKCVDPANCRLEDVAAIRTLPLPTHAAMLAAAMKLPEVAAMRTALHFYADFYGNPNDGPWGINSDDFGKVARTALGSKP